jgi:serine phosphatase RsbU (regulator of sigma subunit)
MFVFFISSLRVEVFYHQNQLLNINKDLKAAKLIIEEQNRDLVDSISYAKHIQHALLANSKLLKDNLLDHFVLYKPRNIVSGDFYWATVKNDCLYFALCDCTGHGVPGAFMSLLSIAFLNEAIVEKNISEPNEVFDFVRSRLMNTMADEERLDGMDGILLKWEIGKDALTIKYAGANNAPILLKANGEIIKLPYDKMSVGRGVKSDVFKNYEISVKSRETLYLSTDGYKDQFGGEKGKKFSNSRLLLTFSEFSDQSLQTQKDHLLKKFDSWKGDLEQVDDVSIVGFRF